MIPPNRPPTYAELHDQFGGNFMDHRPQEQQMSALMQDGGFGSPRGLDSLPVMSSPLLSSSHRTLGPLDATLPSSFDSNGVSLYARLGPIAASVPSKFGLESPPMSLPQESRALKSLHASAFGEDDTVSGLALSPPVGEETLGHRLHMQSRLRAPFMSASLPRTGLMLGDWGGKDRMQGDLLEEAIGLEEDFIPGSLTGDILTPQESVARSRRMSGTNHEDHSRFGLGLGSPRETGSAVGSPIVGSPSRFGPLFTRTKREEEPTLGLGHVGSPLRNSYLQDDHPLPFNFNRSGEASSPRLSALTQRLERARISSDEPIAEEGQSFSAKFMKQQMSRTISTASATNKVVSSIDEELQFSIDDEEEGTKKPSGLSAEKRSSGLGMEDDWKTFPKHNIKPLR